MRLDSHISDMPLGVSKENSAFLRRGPSEDFLPNILNSLVFSSTPRVPMFNAYSSQYYPAEEGRRAESEEKRENSQGISGEGGKRKKRGYFMRSGSSTMKKGRHED